jgi:hypothetical protein
MVIICRLIQHCTSKNPCQRPSFSSVIEILEEVSAYLGRAGCSPVCWAHQACIIRSSWLSSGLHETVKTGFCWPMTVCFHCQRTISTQKLLGEVPGYDLYYSLTHPLKWKPFELETYTDPLYLMLNFYQINGDGEIRTHDRLVIVAGARRRGEYSTLKSRKCVWYLGR